MDKGDGGDGQGGGAELEALRRENAALRARIDELESTSKQVRLLSAVVDNSPSVIFVKDPEGRYILVNRMTSQFYHVPKDAIIGHTDDDFFTPEAVAAMRVKDREAAEHDEAIVFEESVPFDGEVRHYLTVKFPICHDDGSLMGVCGIVTDVTDRKREALERERLHEQIIATQEEALREASTPLVPIAEGIVAMPLIGKVDAERAERIMTALLEGIGQHAAHSVILDITGVRTVDAEVASAIVSAARAVGLLGARVVVTGIRPEVARTLVELGVDLGDIATRGTLQAGIAFALRR